jgi:hypothetical protein
MARTSKEITVAVSRRILWIGAEAYPLQNIARAQTISLAPNRGAAIRNFALWMLVGVGLVIGLRYATGRPLPSQLRPYLPLAQIVVVICVVSLVVLSIIRLIVVLTRRTLYVLIIETAGTPHRALVSAEKFQVDDLVRKIMGAIDNPGADFKVKMKSIDLRGSQGVQVGGGNKQENQWA